MFTSRSGFDTVDSFHQTPRRRNPWCLVGIVLVSFVSLSAMAETLSPMETGVEGVISVSPNRPGPHRIDAPAIGPAANITFAVKKENTTITSFKTDEQGRFRIRLEPGHYTVLREDPGAAIGHWRFEVDVTANQVTKVQWTGNSGMR